MGYQKKIEKIPDFMKKNWKKNLRVQKQIPENSRFYEKNWKKNVRVPKQIWTKSAGMKILGIYPKKCKSLMFQKSANL